LSYIKSVIGFTVQHIYIIYHKKSRFYAALVTSGGFEPPTLRAEI